MPRGASVSDPMRALQIIIFVLFSACCTAQDASSLVIEASFNGKYEKPLKRRGVLEFGKKRDRYNPLMYAGAAFLFVYQHVFSEQIQADCIYQTSCSEYAKQSIRRKGFVKGMMAGFSQVTECFNGAVYEQPPVFIYRSRIVNSHDAHCE